jgi:pantoate--beta-alanine ligase
MIRDLNMDVELLACPIVREPDGLAMSSRNAYLSGEERKRALILHRALMTVQAGVSSGERDAGKLIEVGKRVVAAEPAALLDYFAIVDPGSLEPVSDISRGALVAGAAFVGTTRLIDNILLPPSQ